MTTAASSNEQVRNLWDEFRRLTAERRHNLSPDMINPTRNMTVPQLEGMIRFLSRQPLKAKVQFGLPEGQPVRILTEGSLFEPPQHDIPPAPARKVSKAALEAQAASWEARWEQMGTPEKIRDAQREARQCGSDTHHGKIPEGRYAIPNLIGSNDLSFYSVEQGTGRWENTTFVNRILGGHPDEPVVSYDTKVTIYRAIRELGIEASQILAAHEIRRCRDCGSELTNAVSRMLCQGPVCGGRS